MAQNLKILAVSLTSSPEKIREMHAVADILNKMLSAVDQVSVASLDNTLSVLVGSNAAKTKYESIVNKKG